ncbi:MAG: GNAT family N-acetyltransferase [Clostridia bacterium]|nr:GNAT family N-acetyltransferase [Clostridia bacterium]
MQHIRRADMRDIYRIAEIIVFNYRLNFYPIFRYDPYYFDELSVLSLAETYRDPSVLRDTFVYDDGVVKGVVQLCGTEIKRLFIEPVLQGQGIGALLLSYAVTHRGADHLWALEKNTRAIAFYQRNGFSLTDERRLEEDTDEYLILLRRQ